jgi:hypothetical protein
VEFITDPDPNQLPSTKAKATANVLSGAIASYSVTDKGSGYIVRPFAYVDADSTTIATAQAMLNDNGEVVRVVHGPVPLWGSRRGEDVMMTNALAFDLRAYDPGAPIFATKNAATGSLDVVLTPSDPGWRGTPQQNGADGAYLHNDNMKTDGSGLIGNFTTTYPYVGQGAYVDLGYGYDGRFNVGSPPGPLFPAPKYASSSSPTTAASWFFTPRALSDVYGAQLAPGYAVYDTWSFHYENNGVNEDEFVLVNKAWKAVAGENPANYPTWRAIVDQAVDGLDNSGQLGSDDAVERETAPPYDMPLRGIKAIVRTYERDSRAIRQVPVVQHFMSE